MLSVDETAALWHFHPGGLRQKIKKQPLKWKVSDTVYEKVVNGMEKTSEKKQAKAEPGNGVRSAEAGPAAVLHQVSGPSAPSTGRSRSHSQCQLPFCEVGIRTPTRRTVRNREKEMPGVLMQLGNASFPPISSLSLSLCGTVTSVPQALILCARSVNDQLSDTAGGQGVPVRGPHAAGL